MLLLCVHSVCCSTFHFCRCVVFLCIQSICAAAPFIFVAVLCSFVSSQSVLQHLSFLSLCCVPLYPVNLCCSTFHFCCCVVFLCIQSICAAAPFIFVAVLCSFVSCRSVLLHLSFSLLCCASSLHPVSLCAAAPFISVAVLCFFLVSRLICVLLHLSFLSLCCASFWCPVLSVCCCTFHFCCCVVLPFGVQSYLCAAAPFISVAVLCFFLVSSLICVLLHLSFLSLCCASFWCPVLSVCCCTFHFCRCVVLLFGVQSYLCAAAPFISVAVLCFFFLPSLCVCCCTFHFCRCVVLLLFAQSMCVLLHLSFPSLCCASSFCPVCVCAPAPFISVTVLCFFLPSLCVCCCTFHFRHCVVLLFAQSIWVLLHLSLQLPTVGHATRNAKDSYIMHDWATSPDCMPLCHLITFSAIL